MKTSVSLILSLILVFSYSCGHKNDPIRIDSSGLVTLSLSNDRSIYTEDVIAQTEYVQLGSTGKNPIGEIENILSTDEHIIIVDKMYAKSVFIFNRKGENTATINRIGKGPQEYLDLTHATLTTDKNRIAILDNRGHKVLYFGLDGKFIESKPTSFLFSKMEYLGNDRIVCATYGQGKDDPGLTSHSHPNDLVLVTDKDFHIQQGAFPNRYNANLYHSLTPHLKRFGEKAYVNPSYSDTVYQITPEGIKALYRLDMSRINGTANLDLEMTDEKLKELSTQKSLFYGRYLIASEFALFNVSTPPEKMVAHYLYAKKDNTVYQVKMNPDQYDFISLHLLSSTALEGERFVTAIPAHRLLMVLPESVRKENPLFSGLTDESNPLLVFYTLKTPEKG